MAFGLGRQRLSPADFWAMTPRELACAMAGAGFALSVPELGRADLDALMQQFPD